MKRILCILALTASLAAQAADPVKETKNLLPAVERDHAWLSDVTVEPYGTAGWQGLNGSARIGGGANLVSHITKNFSLWGFAESDNADHAAIDRAGGGLRYEALLGPHIKGDAGLALCYDIEGSSILQSSHKGKPGEPNHNVYIQDQFAFLRLPIGLTINLIESKSFQAGLRAAYAFDISGNGRYGTALGRAFIGPTATLKW